jgi:hypothetical protein
VTTADQNNGGVAPEPDEGPVIVRVPPDEADFQLLGRWGRLRISGLLVATGQESGDEQGDQEAGEIFHTIVLNVVEGIERWRVCLRDTQCVIIALF